LTQHRRTIRFQPRTLLIFTALLIALLVVLYFGVAALIADQFSRTTRHPLTSTPADFGLAYERVTFYSQVDNIPLAGWYIGTSGKTIVVLHAQDGRKDDPTIGLLEIDRALVQHGYRVLTFDFRGYGESGGDRYSLGDLETRDVAGALAFLKGRGVNEVGVLGFSMGAATALNAAPAHPEMRAIVADSSFADVTSILEAQFPKRTNLPSILLPGVVWMARALDGIDLADDRPERAVAQLGDRPVLLIHGTADSFVPLDHAYRLQKAGAQDPNLQLWVVPDAEHVRAYKQNPDEYLGRVLAFFDRYLR
jgi:uncharacterized protein